MPQDPKFNQDPNEDTRESNESGVVEAADDLVAEAHDSLLESEETSESLQSELEESKDRVLRLQAEMENLRNRTAREISTIRRYAGVPLVRDLLPVIDNISRAIEAAENMENAHSLLEGFKLVAQQIMTVLTQHHCTEIHALDEPFDPNLHEAVLQQPSDEHPPGTVIQVTQVGYQLHDRVVRPSQVIVSALPAAESEES